MRKTEEKKSKGKKVETFYDHKSGLECDIFLVGTEFIADILYRTLRADNVSMLRRQISDLANHWLNMEWFPVIEVQVNERYSRDDQSSISFGHERYYLSTNPGGDIYKVDWETDESHRKAQMECIEHGNYGRNSHRSNRLKIAGLPLRAPLKTGDGEYLIDYDEALWVKLEHIANSIEGLQKKLNELVSTKQGIALLLQHGATLQLQDAKPTNHRRR